MSYRLYQLPDDVDDPSRPWWLEFLKANGIPPGDTPMGARLAVHSDGTIGVPQFVTREDGGKVVCQDCLCDQPGHFARVDSTFPLVRQPEDFGLQPDRVVDLRSTMGQP